MHIDNAHATVAQVKRPPKINCTHNRAGPIRSADWAGNVTNGPGYFRSVARAGKYTKYAYIMPYYAFCLTYCCDSKL